jgi:hypothetical protein
MKAIGIITSALLLAGCAWASLEVAKPVPLEKSYSPNGSLALAVVSSSTNDERKLALVSLETKAVLADVLLPKAAPAVSQSLTKTTVLWKRDSQGVAVSFTDRTNSVIFVCVKVKDGRFKWLDLKVAEGPNLGVLGRPRSDFVRIEDTPTRWVDETDHTPRMVYVRTRFWDKRGRRYTVEEEFSISPAGYIGWK